MAHWISHIAVLFLAFLHLVSVVLGILMVHAVVYHSWYDEGTDEADYIPLYLGVSQTCFPAIDLSRPATLTLLLLLSYSI